MINPDVEQYEDKDIIIREGNKDIDFFKLDQGALDVVKGGKKIAEICEPGVYFGEMAALIDEPRTASVVSNGRSKVTRYPGDKLAEVIQDFPNVAKHLFEVTAGRLNDMSKTLSKKLAEEIQAKTQTPPMTQPIVQPPPLQAQQPAIKTSVQPTNTTRINQTPQQPAAKGVQQPVSMKQASPQQVSPRQAAPPRPAAPPRQAPPRPAPQPPMQQKQPINSSPQAVRPVPVTKPLARSGDSTQIRQVLQPRPVSSQVNSNPAIARPLQPKPAASRPVPPGTATGSRPQQPNQALRQPQQQNQRPQNLTQHRLSLNNTGLSKPAVSRPAQPVSSPGKSNPLNQTREVKHL
jgi:CRP-like cAMP-binding protein